MAKLAVRCHPFAPVALGELERWLERLVADLRTELPQRSVRLFRLTQGRPRSDLDVGWLLELELDESQSAPLLERVADALTDMRLLGLQTTLLAPRDLCERGSRQRGHVGMAAGAALPIDGTRP